MKNEKYKVEKDKMILYDEQTNLLRILERLDMYGCGKHKRLKIFIERLIEELDKRELKISTSPILCNGCGKDVLECTCVPEQTANWDELK